jgi:glycosyltransferase involved in cell wall biosynthesis
MIRSHTQCPAVLGRRVRPRILAVCNVDQMAEAFLRPWMIALRDAGYEVHLACRRGEYFEGLARAGFPQHDIPFQRRFNPLSNMSALFRLWRLMRRQRFDAITCHSPVAAAYGRVAAWVAGAPNVIYAVHGFYFHEHTPPPLRYLLVAVEWVLGKITSHMAFVSEEDRRVALDTGIASAERNTTMLHDGIDLEKFAADPGQVSDIAFQRARQARARGSAVVGIVARLVKEKGYQEFFTMAQRVIASGRDVVFLILGSNLQTDRDQFGATLKRQVREAGTKERFIFVGSTTKVPAYLHLMDVFVLPSYREGLPRSILEAMGAGLPVVATDIRGCREEVVNGVTGFIVAPRDADALYDAVSFLLNHPERAAEMGRAGRRRAAEVFDERLVCRRVVQMIDGLLGRRPSAGKEPVGAREG